ncbi:MAG TPA: methyltransferase domain-containing protein [Candidatus Binataceae bacterium]|nr:methyltransferase domain-containing protein [Candidatus Binataceae bacterium]
MADRIYDADRINREQLEFWNNAAAGWKQMWTILERAAQHVSDRLVELARLKAGARVLDIASGAGEPAVTAARKVGPGGLVVATDQSPAMLELARERAATLGLRNMKFVVTGAEELAVEDRGFDAALCRWGLMFVGDLDAAMRRLAQLLDAGARFATAVWGPTEKVPMISLGDDVVRDLAKLPPPPPNAPGPLRLADTKPLERALGAAGFTGIAVEPLNVRFEFESPAAFTEQRRAVSSPFRAMLAKQTPEMSQRILDALAQEARRYADASGVVRMDNEAILIAAHR